MNLRTPDRVNYLLICSFALLNGISVATATEPSPDQLAFFEGKVRPLLIKHCYECHSAETKKLKGGLLLDSKEGWMAGGDSGEAIEPGNPNESRLIESVRYKNSHLQMPPKYQLSEAEISVLERWVQMGAPDPRTGTKVAKAPGIDWEKGKKHWAFQPVARPAIPVVKNTSWTHGDLDHFVLSKIEAAGLRPAPDADRFALIRRVTLDLTGLPPTVSEVGAFVNDSASDDEALAKVVDVLLQSPSFGERWGRHWLDVARYADSVGKTRNIPFPYAWRYRNYVIDAFNSDKPYNEFLAEQVAGDLLNATDKQDREEKLIATGLLALGSMDLNERDSEQFQLDRIDDQMDTLGRATMGLTLGCARCHDHKFDPIAQSDYYAMAGVFASTATLSGQQNRQGGSKQYHQPSLLAKLDMPPSTKPSDSKKNNTPTSNNAAQIAKLKNRLKELQAEAKSKNNRARLKAEVTQIRQQLAKLGETEIRPAQAKNKKNGPEEAIDMDAALAMAAAEGRVTNLALRVRGEPDIKGDVVPRAFPTIFSRMQLPPLPSRESGRREIAEWLASRDHPLTARVMVNRVWAHLLGRGLVETVDNFGASGAAPTHPELLDHLATQFMDEGWSVKSLVRSIVLSRTYRLSGQPIPANAAVDEANSLYWRANLRRLEAEAIRDSLLAAGGMLQTERPAGAPFDSSDTGDLGKGNRKGKAEDPIVRPVRSVYLPVFRSKLPGMFTVFDFAEPDQVNGQRDVTTVPPQALFLLNNPFVVDVAKRAADRILEQNLPDEKTRVRFAYAYSLCRYPSEAETERALTFLNETKDKRSNWAALTQALYSSAEFRYLP
ncbi:MAG: PSD1 and planctomycete cytochrome C domain-containing protein [Planctomycetota bacterium]|nr:PSD1 and planctomycete cytochrome C domain-containing protein [Planctomycetota bacterium]